MKSTTPIPIAVSACLLGQQVRYDGRDKSHNAVRKLFSGGEFIPVPVCPEVAAGLGIPRPAVELVHVRGQIRALGVADRNLDVSERLLRQAEQWLPHAQTIAGLICKSRSPSCGLQVVVHDWHGRPSATTHPGLFIQIVRRQRPELPIIEETALEDPKRRQAFIDQVKTFAHRRGSASDRYGQPARKTAPLHPQRSRPQRPR